MTEDKHGRLRRGLECHDEVETAVTLEDVRVLLEDRDELAEQLDVARFELRRTRGLVRTLSPLSLSDLELLREALEKGP